MDYQKLISQADTINGFVIPNLKKKSDTERIKIVAANLGFVQATLNALLKQPSSPDRDECYAIFKQLLIQLLKEAGTKF